MKNSPVRQNIVETAANLFYQNGYNLTGINEIISKAGIAKATLYNHFKSKDDICVAYLQYKNGGLLEAVKNFTNAVVKGEGRVIALFDFLIEFFESDTFNGCWCINTISQLPKGNEEIRKEIQSQKNQFLNLIGDLVDVNLIVRDGLTASMLAKQIYLLYEGAVSESHIHQNVWPILVAKEMCKKIIS
ncbi:MAG: AcrR family transcriptional regulator [Saprospiraceae bacterium]|jgi:AcrR family transcriptional regulator